MKYFFIFLFLIESTFLTAQENPPVMFQIKTEIEIPEDFKDGAHESLTLLKYSLIDESAQKEAIKEQSDQRKKECYDESCLVDTGKMLAAKGLIIVEITKKEENNYRFKAIYIDIETATTTKITSKYFKDNLSNFEELKNFGKSLIDDLFKATNKEISEEKEVINEEKLEQMVEEKLRKKEEKAIQEEIKRASSFNNKSSVSVLIMGEGIGLSGMYSRRFAKSFAINLGGGFPTLPFVSFSYLSGLKQFRHSFELTSGMNYCYLTDYDSSRGDFSIFGGIGYRYSSQQKNGGFFFRTLLYIMKAELINDTAIPYWGANLGYSY